MELPAASVVIPARDEADALERAIASVFEQDYAGPIEVVVADGMSTDGTRDLLVRLAEQRSNLRWVDNPARVTPAGLNAAITASTGEIIVRCDAHAVLPPEYIRTAIDTLQATGADNVGGVQAAQGRTFLQRAIAIGMSTPVGVGDAKFHIGGKPGPTDTVYLGAFRRSALERVGLFDTTLIRNQDYELNYRIRASGGTVYFDPGLRVTYAPRRTLGALARQYWQYGTWKREVVRRSPESLRWRQLAAPLLVVALLASVALLVTPARWASLVVPASYAAAVIGTTLVELVRRRDAAALALPVVLPTMHLSWGAGFLAGRAPHRDPDIPRLEARP